MAEVRRDCDCWECRRRWSVRKLAPRLAQAHDGLVAYRALNTAQRRQLTNALLKAEGMLAHRELQRTRASITGSRAYMKARDKKLKKATWMVGRIHEALAENAKQAM